MCLLGIYCAFPADVQVPFDGREERTSGMETRVKRGNLPFFRTTLVAFESASVMNSGVFSCTAQSGVILVDSITPGPVLTTRLLEVVVQGQYV